MSIRLYLLGALVYMAAGVGCKGPSSLAGWKGPVEKTNINQGGQATNKIAFLEFDVSVTDTISSNYSCKLASYFLREGTLRKQRFPADIPTEPYHIYAEILDNKGIVLNTIAYEDPLNRWQEAPADDEGKALQSAVIRSNTGKLLIRFQYTPDTRYIRIRLPGKDAQLLKPIYYAQL